MHINQSLKIADGDKTRFSGSVNIVCECGKPEAAVIADGAREFLGGTMHFALPGDVRPDDAADDEDEEDELDRIARRGKQR